MYLAPFLFTFTLVGIVNCLRDFPCKPICYDFYEEAEEEAEEVNFYSYSFLFCHKTLLVLQIEYGTDDSNSRLSSLQPTFQFYF